MYLHGAAEKFVIKGDKSSFEDERSLYIALGILNIRRRTAVEYLISSGNIRFAFGEIPERTSSERCSFIGFIQVIISISS